MAAERSATRMDRSAEELLRSAMRDGHTSRSLAVAIAPDGDRSHDRFETLDQRGTMARAAVGDHWTMGSRRRDSVARFGSCARSGAAGQARAAAKRPPESDRTRYTSPKPSDAPATFRMTSFTSAVR